MPATETAVKEVIPEIGGNFTLDENVIRELPKGAKLLQACSYGTAQWTRAARIDVISTDGTPLSFFLKCATDDMGKTMMEGEFNSMMTIYTYIPTFASKPLAWGKFKESPPDTYFFLMEFLDLSPELPDPIDFCSKLAQLHQMSRSPTGKFGFSSITCHGPNWQKTEWHESWCYYFTRLLDQFFSRWIDHFGPDPQFERAFQDLREHAIPQVLEPLQAEGRDLKPCLIHGDLWEENSGTNLATDQPVVFDAAVMYAHNEFELGMWRRDVVRFGKVYIRQYLRHMPPSEPFDQWDDRNRLYSIKYDLAHGIALPGTAQTQREIIYGNMRYLNDKYPQQNHQIPAEHPVQGVDNGANFAPIQA